MLCAAQFWSSVPYHWRYFWPQGAAPPGFNPLQRDWVYHLAPYVSLFRGMQMGPRHFLKCQMHVGYGPASGPTLKRPCVLLVRLVGQETNNNSPISVTQPCVISFALGTDSHYPTGLSASYQLATVLTDSLVSCFYYLNIYLFPSTLFVYPVFLLSVSLQYWSLSLRWRFFKQIFWLLWPYIKFWLFLFV